jgi:hypothetical protein
MSARTLILELPEPWSLNNLLRISYHNRNQRREMLKGLIWKQMEALGATWNKSEKKLQGWTAIKFVRVDADLCLHALRDDLELPACLKIELDALQECGVIASDGPRNLERGAITQHTGSGRGVRIRLTELERAPERTRAGW